MIPSRARMKPNHKCESPSSIVCVAVEWVQHPNAEGKINATAAKWPVAIYTRSARSKKGDWYGDREHKHESPSAFWTWIDGRIRPREPITIFGSGMHLVTQLLEMWNLIDSGQFSLTIPERTVPTNNGKKRKIKRYDGFLAIDARPFVVHLFSKRGSVRLIDTSNYFDMDIAELAGSFGYSVLKAGDSPGDELSLGESERNKANAIYACMTQTITEWQRENRGNWQPTASRLAMGNFRHEFLKDFDICNIDDKMDRKFQRSALFGGRLLQNYRGLYDGMVYKVDITGLFPSAMLSGMFPVCLRSTGRYEESESRLPEIRWNESVAEVQAICSGDLPVRLDDMSVEYPAGERRLVLCGRELGRAAEQGRIIKVLRYEEYDCKPIFSRYVAYWWSIRKQAKETGNRPADLMAKLMLNSLYGKFAARSPNWSTKNDIVPPCRYGYFIQPGPNKWDFVKWRSIAGVPQICTGRIEKQDTIPAVSAMVTGDSRLYMSDIAKLLPEKSILIQQIDSWCLTQEGWNALNDLGYAKENELGKFRLEETYQWIQIYGPNQYRSNKGVCMVGLPANNKAVGITEWDCWIDATTQDVIGTGNKVGNKTKSRTYRVRTGNAKQQGWL